MDEEFDTKLGCPLCSLAKLLIDTILTGSYDIITGPLQTIVKEIGPIRPKKNKEGSR